jgi:hypothetical protein
MGGLRFRSGGMRIFFGILIDLGNVIPTHFLK